MVPLRSSGEVLRWWRDDVLALTQQQAADALNVQSSALSNWERDARAISIDLDLIDDALKGESVLQGLLWAAKTPDGLEPGRLWTKVFPGPSAPVWVWIRSDSPSITIEAEWGVVRIDTTIELGPNGAFITVGASVPDSPAVLFLSEPGWADFGYGELPDSMPGAPVLSAVSMFSASSADGRFMELFRSRLTAELTDKQTKADGLLAAVPESVRRFVADRRRTRPAAEPHKRWPASVEGIDAVDRQRFARLRDARSHSCLELANKVSQLTDTSVSRDTVRRFENDVGKPHDPMLPVALDHVLGADGRLAVLEIRAGTGPAAVRLPSYWRGPVWVAVDAPAGETSVVLQRGKWKREFTVDTSALVSLHWFDPDIPLRVAVADDVSWRVGVGRRADSSSIDQNWEPTSVDTAHDAVAKTEEAIITAAGRQRDG